MQEKQLASLISWHRRKAGLSQVELARHAGVSRYVVQDLEAEADGGGWLFGYFPGYAGAPVSLALPVREEPYRFSGFPPFLEGLLPEGPQLEAILRRHKIDRGDCFGQLMAVGNDVVGSLTAEEPTQGEADEG